MQELYNTKYTVSRLLLAVVPASTLVKMATIVEVKKAAETATAYFSTVMPVDVVRLEEVEVSKDERFLHITLSGLVPAPKTRLDDQLPPSPLGGLFKPDAARVYKVFEIDSMGGAVRSMKMKKLE